MDENKPINKNWAALGALLAMLAILTGAFAAHALENTAVKIEVFEIAVRYHMYHALAILIVALIPNIKTNLINTFFVVGIWLFSGGLYAYSLSYLWLDYGAEWLGIFAPFGGLSFILGWGFLFYKLIRKK